MMPLTIVTFAQQIIVYWWFAILHHVAHLFDWVVQRVQWFPVTVGRLGEELLCVALDLSNEYVAFFSRIGVVKVTNIIQGKGPASAYCIGGPISHLG
jgi:hypothetical protein